MRIFLAGIMQGSHLAAVLHNQNYRQRLKELLEQHLPGAEVYDPLRDHSDSLDYNPEQGRATFLKHNAMCAEVDLVIAYVPEASMGTAIEMWEAHRAGRLVVAISPLEHNWVIRFTSDAHYSSLEQFESDLTSGKLAEWMATARRQCFE